MEGKRREPRPHRAGIAHVRPAHPTRGMLDCAPSLELDEKPFEQQDLSMKPSEALRTHRDRIRRAVEAHRACNGRVFGSVVHGTDHDGSDLDLLVDALPGATLFDLGGLQSELEELLGIPIDVRTPADLPPKFRDRVLAEAVPL